MLTLMSLLLALPAFASDLRCEAWYQSDGQEKVILPMAAHWTSASTAVFTAEMNDYGFSVTADFALDVMYIDLERGMPRAGILFVTAKLPTAEVFQLTDLHLPGGPRLAVRCAAE